jgi:hypothetical protein
VCFWWMCISLSVCDSVRCLSTLMRNKQTCGHKSFFFFIIPFAIQQQTTMTTRSMKWHFIFYSICTKKGWIQECHSFTTRHPMKTRDLYMQLVSLSYPSSAFFPWKYN